MTSQPHKAVKASSSLNSQLLGMTGGRCGGVHSWEPPAGDRRLGRGRKKMEEKVLVALPAEFKAGRSTLSWALSYFAGTGSTIVIAHVHVPSQMIPVSRCPLLSSFTSHPNSFFC
jgi:hypothetical protein